MSHKQKKFGSELLRTQFRRIALRTGNVQSLSSGAFEKVRSKALFFFRTLIAKSIIYLEHARRNTLSAEDVKSALRHMKDAGEIVPKIYGSPPTVRCETYGKHISSRRKVKGGSRRKASRSSSIMRQIKFYQSKQINCVHLPRAPVRHLIRELAIEHKHGIRLSENAISLIIYALELYIEKQLGLAGLLSIHRKGKGNLSERDVQILTAIEKIFSG